MNIIETPKLDIQMVDVKTICESEHFFQEGIYIRKMLGVANHIFVGAEHKESHTNIVVSGSFDLVVNGKDPIRVVAPAIFTSEAGDQKTAYFYEDTVWLNIMSNPDNEQDLEILDERYVIEDTKEIKQIINRLEKMAEGGTKWLGQ